MMHKNDADTNWLLFTVGGAVILLTFPLIFTLQLIVPSIAEQLISQAEARFITFLPVFSVVVGGLLVAISIKESTSRRFFLSVSLICSFVLALVVGVMGETDLFQEVDENAYNESQMIFKSQPQLKDKYAAYLGDGTLMLWEFIIIHSDYKGSNVPARGSR